MTFYITVVVAIFISVFYRECECIDIISRASWGARQPKSRQGLRTNPPAYVVVHHSDTPTCTSRSECTSRIKNIQTYHMNNKGWADIGYNFLIGGDGNIYEGRGWGIHGSHVPKYNSRSIGICLIGDFQSTSPSSNQLEALESLIKYGADSNKLQSQYRVIGHRQGGATSCPGDALYNIVKTLSHWESNPN